LRRLRFTWNSRGRKKLKKLVRKRFRMLMMQSKKKRKTARRPKKIMFKASCPSPINSEKILIMFEELKLTAIWMVRNEVSFNQLGWIL
tara:strand:- start:123 stop:386 length:264 start_codon:yes stop_codon:yes gene_type:complete